MDFHHSLLTFTLVAVALPVYSGQSSATVNLQATDEFGKKANHLSPGKNMGLKCSYTVDPRFLNFLNGSQKNIFVWDFATEKGTIGSGYKKLLKSHDIGKGWVAIKLEIPYCYKDEIMTCVVLDKELNEHEDKRTFPIGAMMKPVMFHKEEQLVCGQQLQLPSGEVPQFKCEVSGIAPEANFSWSRCEPTGVTECVEDFSKCLWIQSTTASCSLTASAYVHCSTRNIIGHENCVIHVRIQGSGVVNLVASDGNGKQMNYLIPGKIVKLDCTYNNVAPQYLTYYNGTDKNIFVWNFTGRIGEVGHGFEKLVKSSSSGDGWVSIEFEVPYCYKDDVIKCNVIDKTAHKYTDKKTFPIGAFQKPSKINGTNCGGKIILRQDDEFQLTCEVFGVQPKVDMVWSAGCTERHTEILGDTTKCYFNQTSKVMCQMDPNKGELDITCSAKNDIGKGGCTITVKRGTTGSSSRIKGDQNLGLLIVLSIYSTAISKYI